VTFLPELTKWLSAPEPDTFPYDAVLDEFHRVGKHFVADDLLTDLAEVRSVLPGLTGPAADRLLLERFLAIALDKWDGCYDYQTYLGLSLLQLPTVDYPPETAHPARDRLVVHLVLDALRFERDVLDGSTDLLPEMRPARSVAAKRFRLGLRVIRPAAGRIGWPGAGLSGLSGGSGPAEPAEPADAVRRLSAAAAVDLDPIEQRALRLSVLPVWVAHDEYMFIRVLQSFEATFGLLAAQLRGAVAAVAGNRPEEAVRLLALSEVALRESAPLFSLLATMQVESFRTFREWTEGASAIQSRNYKAVESLCRVPDGPRLDAVAYREVPDIRQRVLDGQPSLEETVNAARAAGRLGPEALGGLLRAMGSFAATLQQWRQTHYRIAVRMLGTRTGTGYTEGTPYLDEVRRIPVFRSVDPAIRPGQDGPP
jgi:tryptophan 2,3-dioxygenase